MHTPVKLKFSRKEIQSLESLITRLNTDPALDEKITLASFARMATITKANELYHLLKEQSNGKSYPQSQQQQHPHDSEGMLPGG